MADTPSLEARIVALELVLRGLLVQQAVARGNPARYATAWRHAAVDTLPVTFWPADPETDPLLREAAAALHALFDGVDQTLRDVPGS